MIKTHCQKLLYIDPKTNQKVYGKKLTFKEPQKAIDYAKRINKRYLTEGIVDKKMVFYKCPNCLWFHITTKSIIQK